MLGRYRHIAIANYPGPPELSEICAVEQMLGVGLPAEFVTFLNAAHGGYVPYLVRLRPFGGIALSCSAIFFCGRDSHGEYGAETLIGELIAERRDRQIAREVLPFACDEGGSALYLDLTAEGNGRVIAFVPQLWDEAGFIEVAPCFDAYIDALELDVGQIELAYDEMKRTKDLERMRDFGAFLAIALEDWDPSLDHIEQP